MQTKRLLKLRKGDQMVLRDQLSFVFVDLGFLEQAILISHGLSPVSLSALRKLRRTIEGLLVIIDQKGPS